MDGTAFSGLMIALQVLILGGLGALARFVWTRLGKVERTLHEHLGFHRGMEAVLRGANPGNPGKEDDGHNDD